MLPIKRKKKMEIHGHEELQGKVFNDPIHGHVELHPLLVKIIDTPQFQRLRYIKQLGGCHFVYPGATHTRFEHSIGVAHLAGKLAKSLRANQPHLKIDDKDILCVEIAGLCHDLGHGPFSHMFDQMFIPTARKNEKKLKHEDTSIRMWEHMVESNTLRTVMKKYGLQPDPDEVFIKEMIARPKDDNGQEWPYKGRPIGKSFLYEIVANKTNGVDVDKFDYFARDCYFLGVQNNFDYHRYIMFARVCEVGKDKQKHICVRDKEMDNMTDMFHTRYCLHRRAYQHRVNKIIETMITEAFLEADGHIQIKGSKERMFTLSTAIDDMEAYTKLTDQVFEKILYSTEPELEGARNILNRIVSRSLYKFLGETQIEEPNGATEDMKAQWKQELAQRLTVEKNDIEIMDIRMNYGNEDGDPIENIKFYSKSDPAHTGRQFLQLSMIRPATFSQRLIRFYCKRTDEKMPDNYMRNFEDWCSENFPE